MATPLPTRSATLRRLIVAASLFGVLVVVHLWLQARTGFANGCTGVGGASFTAEALTAAPTAAGCGAVAAGPYADFLGVSNIFWGLLFYGSLTGLRLLYATTAQDRLRLAAFASTGVGVLYSAYLFYLQAVVIGQFCPLCLTSAATVLTLFVLHVIEHRLVGASAPDAAAPAPPAAAPGLAGLRPYALIAGLFVLLLGMSVVLTGCASADDPDAAQAEPLAPLGANAAGNQLASTGGADPAAGACSFDTRMEPIADLAPFQTGPYKGSADDGAVPVTVIFDPNCSHCRDLDAALEPIVAAEGSRARFYFVPYALRNESVGQILALTVAQSQGKFFELKEEMFRRQDATWGMALPEIVDAMNAVGLDGAAFQRLTENDAALQPMLATLQTQTEAVNAAFALPDGSMSVPKVAVGDRVVAATLASYSADCMGEFLTQAAQ